LIGGRSVPWKLFTKFDGILELKYTPVLLMLRLSLYFPGPGGRVLSSSNLEDFPILPQPEPLNLELKYVPVEFKAGLQ